MGLFFLGKKIYFFCQNICVSLIEIDEVDIGTFVTAVTAPAMIGIAC